MLDLKSGVLISVGITGGVIIAIIIPPFWAVLICGALIFVILRFLSERRCRRRR
ncbi:MAG TPA: hypothetical protein PK629_03920 [Oscillospiraceae bacterium]|nr:hypothetical protein [Oscillospiraceae bacterium]HPF56301.1 hypothetical protein [Clostridiales bacterium]HPK35886.1 hypothetical protein [Oscillospiraceae bacterium]HPR76363.1 hypothetical protein [Oscillospiraceae bacterium]